MKLNVEIRFLNTRYGTINAGETESVTVDCDYIDDHDDLVNCIADELGIDENEFEIVNEEQFWEDMDCPASEITNPEHREFDEIRAVLCKYFEEHSNGTPSKEYQSWFSAQDAIDEIADIVGHY